MENKLYNTSLDIQNDFETETNRDCFPSSCFSDIYVAWLENKIIKLTHEQGLK